MLTEKELNFMRYWEAVREQQSRTVTKLLSGLPVAVLFSLPILFSIAAVYFFFPEWYTKISALTPGTFITIVIALLICIVFFSYFRMHYKWEMNEQLYKELKFKENRGQSAAGAAVEA